MAVFTLNEATAQVLGSVRLRARSRPGAPRLPHRTGAPVLRDSIEAGTFEDMFFTVPAKGETDRLLRVARQALDAGRRLRRIERTGERALTRNERLLTALTAGALRVYEELLTLARLNQGRVFPSYDRLAEATALGRATVARGLAILEQVGFLVRQRRFKRVGGTGAGAGGGGGAGPRYAQTSNVYRPTLPQALLGLLPRWLRPAPLPDDQIQRDTDRAIETAAMFATLSCRDLALATVGGPLGRMLAKLGAALDAREYESHSDPQPLLNSYNLGDSDVDLVSQQHSA